MGLVEALEEFTVSLVFAAVHDGASMGDTTKGHFFKLPTHLGWRSSIVALVLSLSTPALAFHAALHESGHSHTLSDAKKQASPGCAIAEQEACQRRAAPDNRRNLPSLSEPLIVALSATVDGVVLEHLSDGFIIENESGIRVEIGTMCPSESLGLQLGDKVWVFGGRGGEGRFASGAILRIHPDGRSEEVPDGACRRS